MTKRAEDHLPKSREAVPPMPANAPVPPKTDEFGTPQGEYIRGSTPGNGTHPHAPPRPPIEREP